MWLDGVASNKEETMERGEHNSYIVLEHVKRDICFVVERTTNGGAYEVKRDNGWMEMMIEERRAEVMCGAENDNILAMCDANPGLFQPGEYDTCEEPVELRNKCMWWLKED